MSLIEMMVAILVLGVILSAFAGSLISFSKMTLVNERRVQATAVLTELHEQLQSIPWEQAAVYAEELNSLAVMGLDSSTDPPTLDGDPLVVLPGPDNTGCGDEPECGRLEFAPRAEETIEIDGRSYDVFQAVSWDTTAPSPSTVKRFTTLVQWRIGEQDYEQRIESTRAITLAEAGDRVLPEIRSLLVSPNTIILDDDGRSTVAIDIDLEFDRGITSALVEYIVLTTDGTETRTLDLAEVDTVESKPISFRGTIPAGSGPFATGEQQLRLIGLDGSDFVIGTRTLTFVAPGSIVLGPAPHIIQSSVSVSRLTVRVGTNGQDAGRLCDDLILTARADGVTGGDVTGVVTAYYLDDTSTGTAMQPVGAIDGSNDEFRREWSAGSVSPWRPTRGPGNSGKEEDVTDRLRVTAENPDGQASNIAISEQITFTTTSNGQC